MSNFLFSPPNCTNVERSLDRSVMKMASVDGGREIDEGEERGGMPDCIQRLFACLHYGRR